MPLTIVENISQDGVAYYLERARAMSVDEAMNVLNNELRTEPWFNLGWYVSQEDYERLVHSNPLYDWNRMERECHCAVICYLLERPNVSSAMIYFCRQALPQHESWAAFPYKGLWFFLIRAFEMLPPFETIAVYAGATIFSMTRLNKVPLLQFVLASKVVNESLAHVPRHRFLLEFTQLDSRYLRDVSFYTRDPGRQDVLVWPFLTFFVFDRRVDYCELRFWGATPPNCDPRDLGLDR